MGGPCGATNEPTYGLLNPLPKYQMTSGLADRGGGGSNLCTVTERRTLAVPFVEADDCIRPLKTGTRWRTCARPNSSVLPPETATQASPTPWLGRSTATNISCSNSPATPAAGPSLPPKILARIPPSLMPDKNAPAETVRNLAMFGFSDMFKASSNIMVGGCGGNRIPVHAPLKHQQKQPWPHSV
jgi:hypothetical protein